MARKKYTMDNFYAHLDEIRERHRAKAVVAPASPIERIRQAVMKGKGLSPKLPRV